MDLRPRTTMDWLFLGAVLWTSLYGSKGLIADLNGSAAPNSGAPGGGSPQYSPGAGGYQQAGYSASPTYSPTRSA